MNNYWIKYKKCPICESEIIRKFDFMECRNGCFGEKTLNAIHKNGYVFDKKFQCDMRHPDTVQKYLNEMYAKINYWRENDRYLVEILGGN